MLKASQLVLKKHVCWTQNIVSASLSQKHWKREHLHKANAIKNTLTFAHYIVLFNLSLQWRLISNTSLEACRKQRHSWTGPISVRSETTLTHPPWQGGEKVWCGWEGRRGCWDRLRRENVIENYDRRQRDSSLSTVCVKNSNSNGLVALRGVKWWWNKAKGYMMSSLMRLPTLCYTLPCQPLLHPPLFSHVDPSPATTAPLTWISFVLWMVHSTCNLM